MSEIVNCSVAWDDSHLPAWGTAKRAQVIVAVEVAGAWGHGVVADAGLRAPRGTTLYAIRKPGRHAEMPSRRAVLVAGGFGNAAWLAQGHLTDEELATFLAGDVTDEAHRVDCGLEACDDTVLLVCTNGRRDACCAVRGRPVALAAAELAPDRVWEVSHIGGHKLAPTGILLPSGQTFGRLTDDDARALVTADGVLPAELWSRTKHRGRVDLAPAECVAETWWREQHPELPVSPPVEVRTSSGGKRASTVELPDGSSLMVTSAEGPALPDSCTKLPKRSQSFVAEPV